MSPDGTVAYAFNRLFYITEKATTKTVDYLKSNPSPHSSVMLLIMPLIAHCLGISQKTHGSESPSIKSITNAVHILPYQNRRIISNVSKRSPTRTWGRFRHTIQKWGVHGNKKKENTRTRRKEWKTGVEKQRKTLSKKSKCDGEKLKTGKVTTCFYMQDRIKGIYGAWRLGVHTKPTTI